MPDIFHRSTNTIAKVTLWGIFPTGAFVLWVGLLYTRSTFGTNAGLIRVQPVPFSHQHHAGDLGIDCRYCHTTVEYSSYAGIPPTQICMNCHSQMWVGSATLEPVRESYRTGKSLQWKRIYNLPGFVYFDHSIHVHKGVGCSECHGRIDKMPFTYQVPSLLMEWCLNCHRQPEEHLRPVAEVFNMKWQRPTDPKELKVLGERLKLERQPTSADDFGRLLVKKYEIKDSHHLTSCTVCHR